MSGYVRNLLKVDTRVQRSWRIAALAAFSVWCCMFFAMVFVSWFLKKEPGLRWFGLFSPLMFVFAIDQIVNRTWYSNTWTKPVKHSPAFWAASGVLWAVFGVLVGTLAALNWLSSGLVR